LATFLKNAGTQTWTGISSKQPFIAIDKYGVDGAYLFDPNFLSKSSATAAFGNLTSFVSGAYLNLANISDADTLKYFGLESRNLVIFITNITRFMTNRRTMSFRFLRLCKTQQSLITTWLNGSGIQTNGIIICIL